jgi:hypothetical protein
MTAERFALGFRVKSGYAIAVALAGPSESPAPLARVVVALSDPKVKGTKQPFHDGFGTAQEDQTTIARLVGIIERCARESVDALLAEAPLTGRRCRRAGLVVGSVIDPAKVGNPHIRAHANEGRLFRTVLADALAARQIACDIVVDKTLGAASAKALNRTPAQVTKTLGEFGRALGSPWRADEKAAAVAAWMALQ